MRLNRAGCTQVDQEGREMAGRDQAWLIMGPSRPPWEGRRCSSEDSPLLTSAGCAQVEQNVPEVPQYSLGREAMLCA